MNAMPMLQTMMSVGMPVDLDHFARMSTALTADMEEIEAEVETLTGYHINVGSPDQVADLLFKKLGLKQARVKLTPSEDRESVEDEVLKAIQHDHACVGKIQDYRELQKLRGTYVDPMPKLAVRSKLNDWRMFPKLGMTRIPSGRLNCAEPNLLAMPSRTKRGVEVRKGFIAPYGWVYVSVDESQIEVRVCAHCSNDPRLVEIYRTGQDIYSDFAINAFNLPDQRYEDPVKGWLYPGVDRMEHRYPSKTCVLAAIYDVSPGGLLEQMPVICATCRKPTSSDKPGTSLHDCGTFVPMWTEEKCEDILRRFYETYPGILKDRGLHHRRARTYGYLWDMWGRLQHIPAARSIHPWVVRKGLREGANLPYQGGAGGTIKLVMAEAHDVWVNEGLQELILPQLMIHDELLYLVREDAADWWIERVSQMFEHCVRLHVPITAGGAKALTWGDIPK